MANYKVPRVVELVDELPLTATGKVVKEVLRQRAGRAPRAAPPRERPTGRPASRRSPTCGWSSWGCGWPRRRPPRSWPTGAPT